MKGWDIIRDFNLNVYREDFPDCTVANGEVYNSVGSVSVPVRLLNKVKLVEFLIVPSVSNSIILGLDFWRAMGIVPDLRRDVWFFSDNERNIPVASIIPSSVLSADEQTKLNKFLKEKWQLMGNSLGCTNLVEHKIDTDSPPLKQRYYPVSPVIQKQKNLLFYS